MTLKEIKARIRTHTNDTTGSIFSEDDIAEDGSILSPWLACICNSEVCLEQLVAPERQSFTSEDLQSFLQPYKIF